MLKHIEEKEFFEEVKNGKVLVDCYADWCGPCRALSPILEEASKEKDDVTVLKLNVDNAEEVCKKYGIMSIPTLLFFKDGELIDKKIGLCSKSEITDMMNL